MGASRQAEEPKINCERIESKNKGTRHLVVHCTCRLMKICRCLNSSSSSSISQFTLRKNTRHDAAPRRAAASHICSMMAARSTRAIHPTAEQILISMIKIDRANLSCCKDPIRNKARRRLMSCTQQCRCYAFVSSESFKKPLADLPGENKFISKSREQVCQNHLWPARRAYLADVCSRSRSLEDRL